VARPGAVIEVDRNTPPVLFHFGEGVRLERLPLGSRIVYPPDPLEPIAHPERAIKRALGKPLDDDPLKSLLRRGMKLTIAFDDLSLPLPPKKVSGPPARTSVSLPAPPERTLPRPAPISVSPKPEPVIAAMWRRLSMPPAALIAAAAARFTATPALAAAAGAYGAPVDLGRVPQAALLAYPLILAWSALLFLPGLTTGELYRTEGLRALLAAQTLRGDWLVPTLYGEPLCTKPPGLYWAIAALSWPAGA